ncbi:MAG: hypothetical protein ACI81R_003049 [Bradymonadia bacterium]|jgi:hypothetical protein
MHSLHATAIAACAVLSLCALTSACAEDSSIEVAGTGSSGGNPAIEDPISLTFQLEAESPAEPERVDWLEAELSVVTIALGRGSDEGGCVFADGDVVERVDLVNFGRAALASVDARNLCALRAIPGADAPLLRVFGQSQRVDLELSFWLDDGVDLTLDFVQRWAEGSRDWIVVLNPESLTADVDLRALVGADGRINLSDRDPQFIDALHTRLSQSVRLYVDPTPGDGIVTLEEQTEENRIGGLRIVR